MAKAALTAVAALLAGTAFAAGERAEWTRPDEAGAKSQASGKPVLYYFLQTQQVMENGRLKESSGC